MLTYLLTCLLTPWSRVLLEKLTGSQLVNKFPAFYGNRKFITAFTSAPHLSLSCASSIQSMFPHPTSCRSTLILFSHLRLSLLSGFFLILILCSHSTSCYCNVMISRACLRAVCRCLVRGERKQEGIRNKTARSFVTFIHLILLGRLNQEGGDLRDGNKYTKLRSESLERNHLQEFQMAQNKSLRIRDVLTGFIYVIKWFNGRFVENDNKSLVFTKPEILLTSHATTNVLRTALHTKAVI